MAVASLTFESIREYPSLGPTICVPVGAAHCEDWMSLYDLTLEQGLAVFAAVVTVAGPWVSQWTMRPVLEAVRPLLQNDVVAVSRKIFAMILPSLVG